jgi:glycosyltransferase involved in cell wall biosynthesis
MGDPLRVAMCWKALEELPSHRRIPDLLHRRWGHTLAILQEKNRDADWVRQAGFLPIPFHSKWNFHPAAARPTGWESSLKVFRPDVLLGFAEPYCHQTWVFSKWARRNRIPFLFLSCQNIDRSLPFPFSLIEKTTLSRSAGAWFLNAEAWERARKRGFSGQGAVIPLGVDLSLFEGIAARDHTREKPTVGYVGRLVEEKGVADLIEACGRAELPLILAGAGPAGEAFRVQAETRGVQTVWMGQLKGDEVLEAYSRIDILVLPSRTTPTWKEQFGRVLVEAMAAGAAVVGSDSGEIPRVIGEAGWVFPEGDVEALARLLKQLATEPGARQARIELGLRRAREKYTWDQAAEGLQGLLQGVCVRS